MYLTAGQWRKMRERERETVEAPNQGPRPEIKARANGSQLVNPRRSAPRVMTVGEARSWLQAERNRHR